MQILGQYFRTIHSDDLQAIQYLQHLKKIIPETTNKNIIFLGRRIKNLKYAATNTTTAKPYGITQAENSNPEVSKSDLTGLLNLS